MEKRWHMKIIHLKRKRTMGDTPRVRSIIGNYDGKQKAMLITSS